MLAGTLNDVSLPEILSLLSHAEKTGSVHLVGDGVRGRIDLIKGSVGMAQSRVGKLGLIRRLVTEGALAPHELAPDLNAAAASPDPDVQLARAAYKAKAITADQLRAAVNAHIVDAMFEINRMKAGRFRFDPCRVADLGVRCSPQEVLDDVAARAEEWEKIRASIPAPGAVVRMAPRITHDEMVVSPSTWRLLALIDGRRTVAELVELVGQGEFEVSQLLHRLVQERLVEVTVDLGKDSAAEQSRADDVLALELELAKLRSDPTGRLSGKLEWDVAPAVPVGTPTKDPDGTGSSPVAAADEAEPEQPVAAEHVPQEQSSAARPAAAVDADTGVEPIVEGPLPQPAEAQADEPALDTDPADETSTEPDEDLPDPVPVADEPIADGPPVVDWADVGLPEGQEAEILDEPEVFTTQVEADGDAEPRRERPGRERPNGRKTSLAASTERRGRLLPEPEPGHDAADLTRRLLEGVGKS